MASKGFLPLTLIASFVLSSVCVFAQAGGGADEISRALKTARAKAQANPSAAGSPVDKISADYLWGTFAESDLPALRKAGIPFDQPVAAGNGTAVYRIAKDDLAAIAQVMHDTFNRCGGFFAHDTKAQAEADLAAAPVARKAAAYTIDQQTWVRPLLTGVQEAQLRSTIETLAAYNNRYYEADTGVQASGWIASRWSALAKTIPGASVEQVAHSEWKQPSVVLTIPGSDLKDEIVVLGGHLDSINGWGSTERRAPGADDNASGIAVLTETVRILAQSGFKPRRTIQVMGYAAEEVGLRGSQDIAEKYSGAGKKVVGVIQFDMTNFKGAENDMYFLTDNVDNDLTAYLERLADEYLKIKWGTIECGYGCSDHASWTKSGYAASCAFEATMETMNHALHTERDTLATSGGNAAHSVNFVKLAIAFTGEMAKSQSSLHAAAAK